MTQPISDGVNSITVCQPIVMTLRCRFQAEDASTTGPNSKKRRIPATGKSTLLKMTSSLLRSGLLQSGPM